MFSGNENVWSSSLTLFDIPVAARYLRFHPVRAENDGGSTNRVNARVSVVVCSQGNYSGVNICYVTIQYLQLGLKSSSHDIILLLSEPCSYPQISCLMSQWGAWSDCACTGSCTQSRSRTIERTPACGGEPCEASTEERICESDGVYSNV